jgi:hypothetical protein
MAGAHHMNAGIVRTLVRYSANGERMGQRAVNRVTSIHRQARLAASWSAKVMVAVRPQLRGPASVNIQTRTRASGMRWLSKDWKA